jgi:Uma2 family endonuclease
MPLANPLTIEDYEQLPEALALNRELVDGELVDVSGNTPSHNRLRDYLLLLLSQYVKKNGLGEVLSEQEFDFGGNAHGPDVSFFGNEKIPLLEDYRRVQRFVPDLAIEIVSQSDTFENLLQKADRYRRLGVREVWIFDIRSRRAFQFLGDRDAILKDDQEFNPATLPGISIRVGDLFDRR